MIVLMSVGAEIMLPPSSPPPTPQLASAGPPVATSGSYDAACVATPLNLLVKGATGSIRNIYTSLFCVASGLFE